jgi:uncharacterized protein (TIGR03435 family)
VQRAASIFVVVCSTTFAQTPKPAFEVASVKLHQEQAGPRVFIVDGGPGSDDPGEMRYLGIPLRGPIADAYGIQSHDEMLGLPGWIDTVRYDIIAKVPVGTTKSDFRLMLQDLLAERFHLSVHYEKKILPLYELVVGKGGPKLKASSGDTTPRRSDPNPRGYLLVDHNISTTTLAGILMQGVSGRLVVDKTGLAGRYDVTLGFRPIEWDTSAPDRAVEPFPNVFTAVQDLGLKLEEKSGPRDVLVVDHLDREPTEN